MEPATFVRHFEDAARVIAGVSELPTLTDCDDVRALAAEMLEQKHLATIPNDTDPAFSPDDGARWSDIRRAHDAIAPMFWGPRVSLDDVCVAIRRWLVSLHS